MALSSPRIFAEIILQSVDAEVLSNLAISANLIHKKDYEIFRYVDDFFIFYNEESEKDEIILALQHALKAKKLGINAAKVKPYQKPIITEITIAKNRILSLLNAEIDPKSEVKEEQDGVSLVCGVNANRLIIGYKTIIKESKVKYEELLNFTFAIGESKIERLLKTYRECKQTNRNQRSLLSALVATFEFSFFVYSASPKVNHTIRICRMIQTTLLFLHSNSIPYELKHLLFKYVHDNIVQLLEKRTMNVYHEIESLYLLTSLSQIGKEYWLPESALANYFLIVRDKDTGDYRRAAFMNHFSITVLLTYIGGKVRYNKRICLAPREASS